MRNPFVFKYVRQLRHDRVDDSGPCVLLATPSMLQVGRIAYPVYSTGFQPQRRTWSHSAVLL